MRILILGNDYTSERFFNKFSENKNNIVFSITQKFGNYIELNTNEDVVDFCEANDINLVLIIDEEYINSGLQEMLCNEEISAFSPSCEAVSITISKSEAKKFMHRNKILTPRFFIADKPQSAYDYIKTNPMPFAIKPEHSNIKECNQFCETYKQAQKIIDNFFVLGNKKIVIEDYIEGKNINVWAISNGYSAQIIGASAIYQDEISLFEPDFITKEIKENIFNNAIMPTITALSNQDDEYIGILGFNFILDKNNEAYLLGYKNFFDDLHVDFFINGFDVVWEDVFDSCIVGDIFSKFQFNPKDDYMLSIKVNDKVDFISAKTKASLETCIKELDYNIDLYYKANKTWKY